MENIKNKISKQKGNKVNIINMTMQENQFSSVSPKKENQTNTKINGKKITACSAIGSAVGIIGAVAGVYSLAKKENPSIILKNLTYDEKDILMIGAGSIIGGLTGGLIADNNSKNKIPKLREASLQFFGSLACPIGILAAANKALDKANIKMPQLQGNSRMTKIANNFISASPKIAATIGSLVLGMNIGNKIMNKVNNKIFNQEENRKVQASDYLVHADDVCVAASLLLKDSKTISAITSKALPASFILAGTKTGIQQSLN